MLALGLIARLSEAEHGCETRLVLFYQSELPRGAAVLFFDALVHLHFAHPLGNLPWRLAFPRIDMANQVLEIKSKKSGTLVEFISRGATVAVSSARRKTIHAFSKRF